MAYTVDLSIPTLVYAPPMTKETSLWGVYSIPRMWREPNGTLVVRLNGEQDNGFTEQKVPHLYFVSTDNGLSWMQGNDPCVFDTRVIMGIDPPYCRRKNGSIIAVRYDSSPAIPPSTPHIKEYIVPNRENLEYVYRYGDIPEQHKSFHTILIQDGTTQEIPAHMVFPEREVALPAFALNGGEYTSIPIFFHFNFFSSTHLSAINELPDGTLVAIAHGQNPAVFDRQCEEVYLVASSDNGQTWTKRGTVATDIDTYPHGYSGDGGEVSLTVMNNGSLICAMRMEMCVNEETFCDTMVSRSEDSGYTWCKPFSAADSSVTPHVVALRNGIVVLVYGRPGVHFKVSQDYGKTWSAPYTIIGKTLEEERQAGINDMDSKYYHTSSYSNTFVERIDDDSFLVLYNSMESFDDAGIQRHKAAFVRRITVKRS